MQRHAARRHGWRCRWRRSALCGMLGADLWLAAVNAPSLCIVAAKPARPLTGSSSESREGVECGTAAHLARVPFGDDGAAPWRRFARPCGGSKRRPPRDSVSVQRDRDVDHGRRRLRIRRTGDATSGSPSGSRMALRELLKNPDRLLLEVGPGNTLSALVRQQTSSAGGIASSRRCVIRGAGVRRRDHACRARPAVGGRRADRLARFSTPPNSRRRVPLPTYPFERKRHWVEAEKRTVETHAAVARKVSTRISRTGSTSPSWRRSMRAAALPRSTPWDRTKRCLVFESEVGGGRTNRPAARIARAASAARDRWRRVRAQRRAIAGPSILRPARTTSRSSGAAERTAGLPGRFVHLWGLTGRVEPAPSDAAVEKRLTRVLQPALRGPGARRPRSDVADASGSAYRRRS